MQKTTGQYLFFIMVTGWSWVFCTSAILAQPPKAPLKVFIMAGQSNMQGHARISTFDYLGDDPKTASLLKAMRDDDGKPRQVKDTWISYLTQGRGGPNGTASGPLTAGYGARTRPDEMGDKIGPEFTFGIRMQEKLGQPVLIIKTAWGGKSLHTDFRPPSAGPYQLNESEIANIEKRGLDLEEERKKRITQSGVCYRYMIDHVRSVLQDIGQVCPEYDESQGYEIAGFVWFQGWNDVVNGGVYPNRGQPGSYDNYSDWLAMFIRDVRKDLGAPQMPFVIGVLGVNGPIENVNERHRSIHRTFRAAMAAPASLPEFQGNVVAVPTAPFWDMPLDRISRKREKLKQEKRSVERKVENGKLAANDAAAELARIESELADAGDNALWNRGASNAGYHYFGCAKTMALIGEAFANALLNLQPDGQAAGRD